MIFEYIWLDANRHIRTKCRTSFDTNLNSKIQNLLTFYKDYFNTTHQNRVNEILPLLPIWNFDGSSTKQNKNDDTEILLEPVNFIKHPFIENSILVLCSCFDTDYTVAIGNTRFDTLKKFNTIIDKDIWFGLEQEFFFFDKETKKPLQWKGAEQIKQGEYYCGVNRSAHIERVIMEKLLSLSIKCGIRMSGINQEVAPTQWEYQIGPVSGIYAADQMIFAKYILYRLCEENGLYASFHPKPLNGEWNGSGCHINFSTKSTRQENGYVFIQEIIEKMSKNHSEFITTYCGVNNDMRLTGKYETSEPDVFTYGVGTRHTSVRIPYSTYHNKRGYIEDRRPGSSIDYYVTLSKYIDYV